MRTTRVPFDFRSSTIRRARRREGFRVDAIPKRCARRPEPATDFADPISSVTGACLSRSRGDARHLECLHRRATQPSNGRWTDRGLDCAARAPTSTCRAPPDARTRVTQWPWVWRGARMWAGLQPADARHTNLQLSAQRRIRRHARSVCVRFVPRGPIVNSMCKKPVTSGSHAETGPVPVCASRRDAPPAR